MRESESSPVRLICRRATLIDNNLRAKARSLPWNIKSSLSARCSSGRALQGAGGGRFHPAALSDGSRSSSTREASVCISESKQERSIEWRSSYTSITSIGLLTVRDQRSDVVVAKIQLSQLLGKRKNDEWDHINAVVVHIDTLQNNEVHLNKNLNLKKWINTTT